MLEPGQRRNSAALKATKRVCFFLGDNMENKYIELALKEANKAYQNGDFPVGCVVTYNNKIIAKAHNKKEKNNNAIEHAEILAISKTCKKLNTWHLEECTLYTTLEPCVMCIGAIAQARIKKIVYLSENKKFGFTNFFKNSKIINHKITVEKLNNNSEYESLLIEFFKNKR